MTFSGREINLELMCREECEDYYRTTPDLMLAHLTETHGYTVFQAEHAVREDLVAAQEAEDDFNDWYAEDRRLYDDC